MPIYEFECQKCGKRFERLCIISSGTSDTVCVNCKSGDVKRLMSGFFSRSSGQESSSSNCSGCQKTSCSGCH